MGAHGPRAGAEAGLRALKAPADRLYGRSRGHALRPRQKRLLEVTLPRLRFDLARAADPLAAFAPRPEWLWLEVGFGGGEHALTQVQAHPRTGLIASEVYENGICSLLAKLVTEGAEADGPLPPNLRLWPDDARTLIRALPAASLDGLVLMFPDPWPKARHSRRRFVHPANVVELARVIKPGGVWRIASDDPVYQAWTAEVLADQPFFDVTEPARERPAGWPPTRYEAKAVAAGRAPLWWELTRNAAAT